MDGHKIPPVTGLHKVADELYGLEVSRPDKDHAVIVFDKGWEDPSHEEDLTSTAVVAKGGMKLTANETEKFKAACENVSPRDWNIVPYEDPSPWRKVSGKENFNENYHAIIGWTDGTWVEAWFDADGKMWRDEADLSWAEPDYWMPIPPLPEE